MSHARVWSLLDQFLDGELDPEARWAVASHLDDCPTCAAELARRARARAALRPKLAAIAAPPNLRGRILANLAAASEPPVAADPPVLRALPKPEPAPAPAGGPRRPFRLAWASALVAAVFAVAIVTAGWFGLPGRGNDQMAVMTNDLAVQHQTFAHDETLLDVRGTDAQISTWLDKELKFPVRTPALPGYELAGARLVTIGAAPAAQLVYERPVSGGPAQYVSLVLFDPNGGGGPSLATFTGQRDDMSIVGWQAPDCRAALVAELPPAETMTLAKTVWNEV
ncbi:MAG TPA: zf-HC2 domain-containing protein [Thermomicrobiales bacterium]|nr:zf-HC2 domain-containing protein [Thermomicrobiales bacterium]